jgi:DNA-binding MarR family transcriptional regulator
MCPAGLIRRRPSAYDLRRVLVRTRLRKSSAHLRRLVFYH